jgi:hypothetical protein
MSSKEPNHPQTLSATSATLAELRAHVLETAKQDPAPTRAQLVTRRRAAMSAAILISLAIFVAMGGVRASPRPDALVVTSALGSMILAFGVASMTFGRARSMLGRPRALLTSIALFTPIALFSWRAIATAQYPNMAVEWTERSGVRCLLLSGALALAPVIVALWLRRGSDPVHPRATAAGLAAAVGASVWVLVDLWCPVGYVPHLLLGHVLPLTLLIAVSALVGGWLLKVRRNTYSARPMS